MGGGVSLSHAEDNAKAKGDTCFKLQDYHSAVYWYTLGIAETVENDEKLSILLSNRSAAYFECECYEKALSDAEEAVCLRPDWCKGYFRASKAAFSMDRQLEALRYVDKALALTPNETSLIAFRNAISTTSQPSRTSTAATWGPTWAYSWGCDDSSQLGLGSPNCSKSLPSPINAFRGIHLMYVSCGASHTVAISSLGDCYSWGSNEYCQLGVTTTDKCVAIPILISALVGLRVVACCCGAGQIDFPSLVHPLLYYLIYIPPPILPHIRIYIPSPLYSLIYIPPHTYSLIYIPPIHTPVCPLYEPPYVEGHNVVVTDGGKAYSWGINRQGQCGLGHTNNQPQPTQITGISTDNTNTVGAPIDTPIDTPIVAVSCGISHTMILLSNGSLAACGSNQFGQLGDASLPTMVVTPAVVVLMEPKADHDRDQGAKGIGGWDGDGAKDSGDGGRTGGGRGGPTGGRGESTGGCVRVSHVACGGAHTVIIDVEGRVYSAGSNSCGQLGRAGEKDG